MPRQQQADVPGRDRPLDAVHPHAGRAGVHEHELQVALETRAERATRRVRHRADTDINLRQDFVKRGHLQKGTFF